ncbi:spore coat protein GerQ [Paenibacillus oenotherae]|uniref:Spore coat protein GerQ n=1 Tax=Paenibacillus oenotherae TaxID=1435645 RepID=A0ABS7D3F8_9BACL|nr:spore coat protein GerQ [Paenibacillus oenotherae]MBW7474391.1 spore coat protein GerQ [Paenibacillus oenotherae]
MSNYGYNNVVNPASVGGQAGFNPGYGQYPHQPVAQPFPAMPMTLPAQVAGAQTMMPPGVPSGAVVTPAGGNIVAMPVVEESYVENILRLNRGKMGTFYMTYENNREWNAKIFRGVIEAAGRDHVIISDPSTGMRYLLLMLNLDYVTFDGPIAYEYPFQGGSITNKTPLGTATLGTVTSGR